MTNIILKSKLDKNTKNRQQAIIEILLKNRGLISKQKQAEFFQPIHPEKLSYEDLGIKKTQITKVLKRLKQTLDKQEKIIIYGDYDADGVTSTAVLWETLHSLGFEVMPFLPDREKHGYGLKPKGIDGAIEHFGKPDLLITVDNGIVAFEGAKYCQDLGIDLIICDHHEVSHASNKTQKKATTKYPEAISIVHSTQTAGVGVAYFLAKAIAEFFGKKIKAKDLELAAIGVVADIVPLLGVSRSLVKYGLELLPKSQRPGLKALFTQSGLAEVVKFSTYHIGFVIGPRLNATGRLQHSIDSLRLLCTTNEQRAIRLAIDLHQTNQTRQEMTNDNVTKVIAKLGKTKQKEKIIITSSADYHPGVIGLIAGKITEKFSRPAIAISLMDGFGKGSVRSVAGVNIIKFLRNFESDFVDLGGHPLAAGFTVEIDKLAALQKKLEKLAQETIDEKLLVPSAEVETKIEFGDINLSLVKEMQKFAPFGLGNPKPVFLTKNVEIAELRPVGKEGKHLKLSLKQESIKTREQEERIQNSEFRNKNFIVFDGIMFNAQDLVEKLKIGDKVDVVCQVDINQWGGREKVELMVREVANN